jgi:hypothetical protein
VRLNILGEPPRIFRLQVTHDELPYSPLAFGKSSDFCGKKNIVF